jgi:hypothetical protein
MIRLASSPTPNLKLLARSALTMLSSPELMKASNSRLSETSDAALDALRDWAKGDGHVIDIPPASGAAPLAALASDHPLEIAIKDWDVLFRAVEARLLLSVGDKLTSVPKSRASDAADLVQSTVMECVTALHQLHIALTQERDQRDPAHRVDAQATQAPGIR